MNPEVKNYVDFWANDTTERLKAGIDKLIVRDTGELKASIRSTVSVANSDIRVKFSFMLKGKFSDMGAGRGQPANTQRSKRIAKKWASPVLFGAIHKLQAVVQSTYMSEVRKIFEK